LKIKTIQGKEFFLKKLFTSFQLSHRVPEDNFYRCLRDALDLHFPYRETNQNYGDCGQKSIDLVVFYKLCLIGYLEDFTNYRNPTN
jgi:transposase